MAATTDLEPVEAAGVGHVFQRGDSRLVMVAIPAITKLATWWWRQRWDRG